MGTSLVSCRPVSCLIQAVGSWPQFLRLPGIPGSLFLGSRHSAGWGGGKVPQIASIEACSRGCRISAGCQVCEVCGGGCLAFRVWIEQAGQSSFVVASLLDSHHFS